MASNVMLTRTLVAFLRRPLVCASPVLCSAARRFATLPDHQVLGMPLLSPTMTKGTIAKWNKKEGDKLKAGDILVEVETDKATVGYEVTDEGYLAKILMPEGAADVNLGIPIAVIVEDPKSVPSFKDFTAQATPAAAQSAPVVGKEETKASVTADSPVVAGKTGDRLFVSPIARKMSAEKNLDLSKVVGTGPAGRIIKADVLSALEKQVKPTVAAPPPLPPPRRPCRLQRRPPLLHPENHR